jgi:hypothetical protein
VFDPNEMITDPKTNKQVNKYVFDKPTVDGQAAMARAAAQAPA